MQMYLLIFLSAALEVHYPANTHSLSCEFSVQGDISWLHANIAHREMLSQRLRLLDGKR